MRVGFFPARQSFGIAFDMAVISRMNDSRRGQTCAIAPILRVCFVFLARVVGFDHEAAASE